MRNTIASLILLACEAGWALLKWGSTGLAVGLTYYMIQFWPGEHALYGKDMATWYTLVGFAWLLTCVLVGIYWFIEFSGWWTEQVAWAKEQKRRQVYYEKRTKRDS